MAGGQPLTPDTPRDAAEGGKRRGSTVDNRNIENHGGVVTGNNNGYNVITGIFSRLTFSPRN